MPNRLFQETQNNSLMNRLMELKENPQKYFLQSNLNVPPEYSNSPQDAVNYLVRSGQVRQERVNQVMQIASNMGIQLW